MAADTPPNEDTPDMLATARQLTGEIAAARQETERLRQLPKPLAQLLANAGLYRMYLPKSLGGFELSPLTVFETIEELSKADGVVGWCLMNANGILLGTGWIAEDTARRMFGQPPNVQIAGSLRPPGRAWPAAGGFRIKGYWNFASGLHNANWLSCPCLVMDGDTPQVTPTGAPVTRTMFVPATSVKVVDTWSVMGMRGTGSDDFTIDDLFVPGEHSYSLADPPNNPGPLYRARLFITQVHALFAANALGIARGAIEAMIDVASREATSLSSVLLRDRPFVQSQLAQAEAIVNAARSYAVNALTQVWAAVCANEPDPSQEIAQVRLAIVHAIRKSVRAVDLVFHAAGTNAIYTANPLERQFRDIHVAVQHAAAFPAHYESAGKVLVGLRPTDPGW